MFVRNKSLINTSSSIHWFQLKYKSSIHNIVFSIEKVVLSESGEKHAQIKHLLQVKTVQNWSGVDYCDVLSAVWTLILTAPIHCRGSAAEQVM